MSVRGPKYLVGDPTVHDIEAVPPGVGTPFASIAEVQHCVTRELRGLSVYWWVEVVDADGAAVWRGTRDGHRGTGPLLDLGGDPMTSHTHMSDEAITATIDAMQAQPGHTYPVELSYTDFSNLMWALQKVWHDGHGAHSDGFTDLGDWAGTWARSIAATLGVQML